jgi:hypothetical protein
MIIETAKWQPKSAKDRTKSAGAWVCPKCGQRLATFVLDYQPRTRMCGGGFGSGAVLVLPKGVDPRGKTGVGLTFTGPFYFGAEVHFEKTKRHAARQAHGQSETWTFDAHLAESRNEGQKNYAKEKLLEIKKAREPMAPVFLDREQLPATFQCSRPGCKTVSLIEFLAPRDVLIRLEKREQKQGLIEDAVMFSPGAKRAKVEKTLEAIRPKMAKDVWFG